MGMRATGVKSAIRAAFQSQTASSTAIMAIGMGLRLIFQMLAFVLVSRVMGAAEFGAFGSVAALVGIIGAFSGWGADVLIIKTVARMPNSFAQAWGSGLVFLAISAPPLALSALLVVPVFVAESISHELILFVALADIIFARINAIGAACYQAVDRPMGSARLYAGFNGTRLVAALLWVRVAGTDAQSWA
jgi:O-antigen/teichoic acid export membrane protein